MKIWIFLILLISVSAGAVPQYDQLGNVSGLSDTSERAQKNPEDVLKSLNFFVDYVFNILKLNILKYTDIERCLNRYDISQVNSQSQGLDPICKAYFKKIMQNDREKMRDLRVYLSLYQTGDGLLRDRISHRPKNLTAERAITQNLKNPLDLAADITNRFDVPELAPLNAVEYKKARELFQDFFNNQCHLFTKSKDFSRTLNVISDLKQQKWLEESFCQIQSNPAYDQPRGGEVGVVLTGLEQAFAYSLKMSLSAYKENLMVLISSIVSKSPQLLFFSTYEKIEYQKQLKTIYQKLRIHQESFFQKLKSEHQMYQIRTSHKKASDIISSEIDFFESFLKFQGLYSSLTFLNMDEHSKNLSELYLHFVEKQKFQGRLKGKKEFVETLENLPAAMRNLLTEKHDKILLLRSSQ